MRHTSDEQLYVTRPTHGPFWIPKISSQYNCTNRRRSLNPALRRHAVCVAGHCPTDSHEMKCPPLSRTVIHRVAVRGLVVVPAMSCRISGPVANISSAAGPDCVGSSQPGAQSRLARAVNLPHPVSPRQCMQSTCIEPFPES